MGSLRWRVARRLVQSYAPKFLLMFVVVIALAVLYGLERVRERYDEERSKPYELNEVVLAAVNAKARLTDAQKRQALQMLDEDDRSQIDSLFDEWQGFENDRTLRTNVYGCAEKIFALPSTMGDGTEQKQDDPCVSLLKPAFVRTTKAARPSGNGALIVAAMVGGTGTKGDSKSENRPGRRPAAPRFATPDELFTELYERSTEPDYISGRAQKIFGDTDQEARKIEGKILAWEPLRLTKDTTQNEITNRNNELQAAVAKYNEFASIRQRRLSDLTHEANFREKELRRRYFLAGVADLARARRQWHLRGRHGVVDGILNHDSPLYLVYAFSWYGAVVIAVFALGTLIFGLFRAFSVGTTENVPAPAEGNGARGESPIEDMLRKTIATVAALGISAITVGSTVKNALTSPIDAYSSTEIVKLDAVPQFGGLTVADVKKTKPEGDGSAAPPTHEESCASCDALKPYAEALNRSIAALDDHLAALPAQVQSGVATAMTEPTRSLNSQLQKNETTTKALSENVAASTTETDKLIEDVGKLRDHVQSVGSAVRETSETSKALSRRLGSTNYELGSLAFTMMDTKKTADQIRTLNERADGGMLDQAAIADEPPLLLRVLGRDEYKSTELAARALFRETASKALSAGALTMTKHRDPLRRSDFLAEMTAAVATELEAEGDLTPKGHAAQLVDQWKPLILRLTHYPR